MATNPKRSKGQAAKEYFENNKPGLQEIDETSYEQAHINDEKMYINTDSLVILNMNLNDKKGLVNYNWADDHMSLMESRYKRRFSNLKFTRDYVSTFADYAYFVHVLNDIRNSGQVRPGERDGFEHNMTVRQTEEVAETVTDEMMEYIASNVQANHEEWFQNLVGINPVVWGKISKVLYTRGIILMNITYANGETERGMLVHKMNKQAEDLAAVLGCTFLLAADDHKVRYKRLAYKYYNTRTNEEETRVLNTIVAAPSLPISNYSAVLSMRPSATTALGKETYFDKNNNIKHTVFDAEGLEAIVNSLKPRQLEKVDKFEEKLYSETHASIHRILNSKKYTPTEKVVLLKNEILKLVEKHTELQTTYAKAKKKEIAKVEKQIAHKNKVNPKVDLTNEDSQQKVLTKVRS